MEDLSYFNIMIIGFFLISTYVLIINLYTIAKLRKENKENLQTQKLLASLIGEIQGYFSQIDQSLNRLGKEEQRLTALVDGHQNDESHVLKALETNQELFLERMDRIVSIQHDLLKQITFNATQEERGGNISPEMIKAASIFMQTQKRDLQLIKTKLDFLPTLATSLESVEDKISHIDRLLYNGFDNVLGAFSDNVNHASQELLTSISSFNQTMQQQQDKFLETQKLFSHVETSTQALQEHINIIKKNMIELLEKSLDLNPVYKSISELLEKMQHVFDDYHIAKGEMESLFSTMKVHEREEFLYLRKDVNDFLIQIEAKINSAVEQLKKEYHLGQNQISDTVKTLSDRSIIKSAYTQE